MAHVHKQTYTKPVPAGARPVTVKGRACVRWKGRDREWVVAELIPEKPGRCRCSSAKWYVTYFDRVAGAERTVPGYTDRAATDALMVRLVKTSERIDSGLLPAEAAAPPAAVSTLLAEFESHIRASGRSARYARDRALYARRVIDAAGAQRPAALTPAAVTAAVARIRGELGLSPLTAGYHVSAVKQFTRWLALHRKSEATDHLSALVCERDGTRPTFTRRTLAPGEFAKLVAAAAASADADWGLDGRERAALYMTAASTGLRANELASLAPAQFALGADPPTVTARAAYAKGRRHDVLPLPPELVAELAPLLAGRGPAEPVWPSRRASKWAAWHLEAAQMLARDLAAAGLPRADAAGAVYDFHALRSQFATDLERAGVGLAAAQRLMRHSTPALTSKHYTRRSSAELAAEVNKLAAVRAPAPAGTNEKKETAGAKLGAGRVSAPRKKRTKQSAKGGRPIRFT